MKADKYVAAVVTSLGRMRDYKLGNRVPFRRKFVPSFFLLSAMLFIGGGFILKSQGLGPARHPSDVQQPSVAVTRQLQSNGLVTPVELLRPSARLSAANQLEEYSCIVKNNAGKTVAAFSLAWNIVTEVAGKQSSTTLLQVSDTLIHRDFQKSQRSGAVPPGAQVVSAEDGPTYFEGNASVKRVGVSIDYVEFEDGTSLGPNLKGTSSHLLAMEREGASKYKEWLAQIYTNAGRSSKAVVSQLQSESLPEDLSRSPSEIQQGARAYRRRMLNLSETGASSVAIQRFFNK